MFKNIKSLFIVEEEDPKKPEKKTQEVEKFDSNKQPVDKPKGTNTPQPNPTPKPILDPALANKPDNKFLDILFKAMEKNNPPGFDYMEYRNSLNSLSKMPMDEATKYKSAYAMAQTMGATPKKLVDSAQHYVSVLKTEEKKFQAAMANQNNVKVVQNKEQIKMLSKTIQEKTAQIKKLTQEIEAHQKKIEAIQKTIDDSSMKVETTKTRFDASINFVLKQINLDVANMKKYLK